MSQYKDDTTASPVMDCKLHIPNPVTQFDKLYATPGHNCEKGYSGSLHVCEDHPQKWVPTR